MTMYSTRTGKFYIQGADTPPTGEKMSIVRWKENFNFLCRSGQKVRNKGRRFSKIQSSPGVVGIAEFSGQFEILFSHTPSDLLENERYKVRRKFSGMVVFL